MWNTPDLTGKRFGKVVVLEKAYTDKHKHVHWKCLCDCGNLLYPDTNNLNTGNTTKCKLCAARGRYEDLSGKRFGKLVVKKIVSHKPVKFECLCDCGNTSIVRPSDLKTGKTRSCGCGIVEACRNRSTHSMTHSRVYSIWANMITRCENPKAESYSLYGGRGIKVCEEWHHAELFIEWAVQNGYADDLTIDRIDTNGNYEPDNCRWATVKEQANNTRRNRYIEYKGITKTLKQWAEEKGWSEAMLRSRLNNGWSIEKTLETPRLRIPHNRKYEYK